MSSFSINSSIPMNNFNNSISEFNKVFNESLNNSNKAFSEIQGNFQDVFNSISQTQPLEAGVQYQQIGMDAINAQKIEDLSPTAKTLNDIGNGLRNSIIDLNDIQKDAENKAEIFAAGGDISIHDVMISAQKSSLSMQMAIQLRNQVLNAYNELRNMQL